MTPAAAAPAQPYPDITHGDEIYFRHRGGDASGVVKGVGQHGLLVDTADKRHKVRHEHVLAHKTRVNGNYRMVDRGEDGGLLEGADGKRRFVAGELPQGAQYADKAADVAAPDNGELVTRAIETALRDCANYTVLARPLPDAPVHVHCLAEHVQPLLAALSQAGVEAPYEALPATQVRGPDEAHAVWLAFSPEPAQTQDLVNAAAAHQRNAGSGDQLLVRGRGVNGMRSAQLAVKTIGGRAVLVLGARDGFDMQPVAVSTELEALMTKAHARLLFFKAGPLKNKTGLTLQDVTDKAGHQTKRWKGSGGEPPKAERETRGSAMGYGTHNIEAGDTLKFRHHATGEHHEGRVAHTGADGARVTDQAGTEHQVAWHEVTGHEAGGKGVGADEAELTWERKVLGSQQPIDAATFKAADYYTDHDDPNVTEADILKDFPPDTAEKIRAVVERLKTVEQTINTYKKGGQYTPERRVLHQTIINKFLSPEMVKAATPADGATPTFTILGGRGGSGKKKFRNKLYDPNTAIVLDNDLIKEELKPDYEGWNAQQVHEEASDLFDELSDRAIAMNLNLVHDATLKSTDKNVEFVQAVKDMGYRIEAHYMHLPRHEAAKRAVKRFLGKEGRFVPVAVILENTRNEVTFDAVRQLADKWSFWDNNVDEDQDAIQISKGQQGRPVEDRQRLDKSERRDTRFQGFAPVLARKVGQDQGRSAAAQPEASGLAVGTVLFFKARPLSVPFDLFADT